MHLCRPALPLLALTALLAGPVAAQDAISPIRGLMEAFNAHDAEAMGAFVTDDVEIFYVDDAGVPEIGTRGRSQLATQMTAYFEALPEVASSIESILPGPVYVSVRERIVDGAASLAVYEVRDGLIRRVWYYPVDSPAGG